VEKLFLFYVIQIRRYDRQRLIFLWFSAVFFCVIFFLFPFFVLWLILWFFFFQKIKVFHRFAVLTLEKPYLSGFLSCGKLVD